MYFEIVTKNIGRISAENLKIENSTIFYKVNNNDTIWNDIPETFVKYIGISGHLRDYV